jgi:hypothetical protein
MNLNFLTFNYSQESCFDLKIEKMRKFINLWTDKQRSIDIYVESFSCSTLGLANLNPPHCLFTMLPKSKSKVSNLTEII